MAAARVPGKRGGARPGAGRKAELVEPISLTVDVEAAQMAKLEARAADRGVSKGRIVREALRAYLSRPSKRN